MDNEKNHLGTKLQSEADRLGLNKKQLAEHFGMQVPSIYDTLKFGRLDKKHYQALVNLNNKPLEWWFDVSMPVLLAREDSPEYKVGLDRAQPTEIQRLYDRLPKSEQAKLVEDVRKKVEYFDQMFEEMKKGR